jgi:hypothetical protein
VSQLVANKMNENKNATLPSSSTDVELKVKKHLKLLSWNIDGLDSRRETLTIRTHGVIDVIKR